MNKKNKREDILEAAFTLLRETGDISRLNLRKTAERAGCAHTNVYNYFPSLESLKWAMLEQALMKLEKSLFDTPEEQNNILKVISRYIDFALLNPELYKFIWIADLNPEAKPSDTEALTRIPSKLLSYADPAGLDIAYSYVHGKLLNIICCRTEIDDPETGKKEILDICRKILEK